MESQLERIRALSPSQQRVLGTKLSEWLAAHAQNGNGAKALAVFYVPRGDLPAESVRAFLQERLPDQMLAAEYVAVDELPKTVNGKVDRAALQHLRPERAAEQARPTAAPANERERQMADIWSRILNVPHVGVEDNFFALGGHSLLATQVIMEIEQLFGLEIPLGAIFKHPTVAQLCRHLEGRQPAARPASARPDRAAPVGDIPLSNAQRRLWYASQLSDDGLEYKVVKVLDMHGALNAAALSQAVGEVINRHETLRTSFGYASGKLVQKIMPATAPAMACVDLTPLSPAESEPAYAAIESAVLRQPFDLETGPLVRITLVRYSATHARLIFDVHHIVVDGWSFGILVQELNSLFRRFSAGLPSDLAPLPAQYRDVAIAERRRLSQADLDRQLAYWRSRLAGTPRLVFQQARVRSSASAPDHTRRALRSGWKRPVI